jgi:hypothetical protein
MERVGEVRMIVKIAWEPEMEEKDGSWIKMKKRINLVTVWMWCFLLDEFICEELKGGDRRDDRGRREYENSSI